MCIRDRFKRWDAQGDRFRKAIAELEEKKTASRAAAEATRDAFAPLLAAAHFDPITTEIVDRGPFYFAEEYHQQYLEKRGLGSCHL